jgi:hypothetical protein
VLTYLQDRRVLYAPWDVEVPEYCMDSALEMQRFLTDQRPPDKREAAVRLVMRQAERLAAGVAS